MNATSNIKMKQTHFASYSHLLLKIVLISASFFLQPQAQPQYLAAFNDNLKHFWVFEAGIFNKLEHLEIQEYQVGGILIAYIDNSSSLKIYRNGKVETLLAGNPIKFQATDYLLGFSLYEQLNVYDNGKTQILSTQCKDYIVQDSLIAWYNYLSQQVQVYYKGNIITIEDGLIYSPIQEFKTGDNTIAYIQKLTKEFKVFYQGKVLVLDQFVEDMVYETGRDIVAYMDRPDMTFKVLYKGADYTLETFEPKSFQVGDEMMAYVDNLSKLKLFENGEVTTIAGYEPTFYTLTDRVIVFEEQGFFKTWCNGEVYIIERYLPQPHRIDFNSIAYLDQNNFVKAFQNCQPVMISFEKVKEISLIRDLIIFVESINKTRIYFNGQIYEP
jgi:hypothetical protein